MDKLEREVVAGFGAEWEAFDQRPLSQEEHEETFERYFNLFPFEELATAEGFDLGCGSGRWAALVANKVGKLHCIDPAAKALNVARKRLGNVPNVEFHLASADAIPLPDDSQGFGYSLGVLHHIRDTEAAMRDCVRKLKPGAPFLVYLYYDFDNRPRWYRTIWKVAELGRSPISRLPFAPKRVVTDVIAALVYYPLTRVALLLEKLRVDVQNLPLSAYRQHSFYTMRTDALDRFGTRLEQRFTREQIHGMMSRCGLTDIAFREDSPFWVACGRRKAQAGEAAG